MRRYRHRFSKDIDIFVPDPQYLGHLSPRLNDIADGLTMHFNEQANFLKLYLPEGEIDFVVASPLTQPAARMEHILGRQVQVETSVEIIAKKIYHRGKDFTARDILDLALLIEKLPEALVGIRTILRERREAMLARIDADHARLRAVFSQLAILEYRRSYDECVDIVRTALINAG
ncbi:nucleotidyl transferase AbiEii/AbiGii toxin family protein [Steroidobacter gossypii]